jgi:transcription-repair coupling factor (superfamily II helicase)
MALPQLLAALRAQPDFQALDRDLRAPRAAARLGELPGSAGAVLVAALAEAQPSQRFVVIAPGPSEAERWLADLAVLLSDDRLALYPQREGLGDEEPHYEIAGERVETLESIAQGTLQVVVTTARASAERTLMPAALSAGRLEISKDISFREVVRRLEQLGYERVPQVSDVAQFAVRGGIVDVYGFGMALPARAEYWGDELAALRAFDLGTQRSAGNVDRVTVLPVNPQRALGLSETGAPGHRGTEEPIAGHGGTGAPMRSSLLDLVPAGSLLIEDDAALFEEDVLRAWDEAEHHADVARRLGEAVPPRSDLFLAPEAWRQARGGFARLALGAPAPTHQLPFAPPPPVARDLARLAPPPGGTTLVLCDNEGQLERLDELLHEGRGGPLAGVVLAIGALDGGFVLPPITVLTDHEIFHRARRLRRTRRYRQSPPASVAGALQAGDLVVHLEHGIGIYRGIQTITVQNATIEVAAIAYEGGDLLHVPLYRIDQLERFRSVETDDGIRALPKLHKLGGTKWKKQRAAAEEEVRRMAAELLELYARRQLVPGYAFPPDTRWQRELESSFLYEDTPDQRKATQEVKRDMEQPRPMDRLVVGDVGYGKTEIAVRAAFKAVQAGKQVVVLAPTTILVEQHLRTFGERFADYPVRLAALSRLHTAKESQATLAGIAAGSVDLLIGTHRLLSPDVVFKDLGLVVVDEEHRFGVDHKERLKKLRLSVDVLTMTATPIPRTLQLSLAGLRDLTLIETPPRDRSPVLTFVEPWDDGLIEESLARELDRGGQVYVVHNRIETLETIAERIRRLAPRAAVAHAHGQMRPKELDEVMRRFVAGTVDILVSTMIVESGLDVPNANTMLVHHAEMFGLAQLYQLRGRVGRSHRRAHCYLIVPDAIDRQAEARLNTLAHHTELGAGYRIALKDLELRGAGNILGAEQSGFAMAVGVDMYLRMLEETVKSLKAGGEGREAWLPPEVLLERSAFLPDGYVADDAAKLDLYRRLARSQSPGEIQGLQEEMADRFGRLPPEAEALVALTQLRVIGARLGLETIVARGNEARLNFRVGATPRLARLTAAMDEVQFHAEVRRTQPLVLRLERLGGMELLAGLVRALTRAVADPT